MKKQDLEHAKGEFLKEVSIEPDVAYDYDQLGLIAYLQQQEQEAEKMLCKALQLDSRFSSSYFQLASVYLRQGKFPLALTEIDAAGKLAPGSESVHYLPGQILE